jgi:ABC-type phosphate/phosphonate transport system substrate-binding protein
VQPFKALIRTQTGLASEVKFHDDLYQLGRALSDGKVRLGVFQGVEFAWVRQRFPELRPLMIIVDHNPHRRSQLLVRADRHCAGFADLRGKTLAMPRDSRLHLDLFLERACRAEGQPDPTKFFARFLRPTNAEDALDDLVDGATDALLIDRVALESYQRRKPARSQRLKVIQESEIFPATAIVHRPGHLTAEQLRRFQDGLLAADKMAVGRHLMALWRLTSFAAVPADYEPLLTAIIKVYPPPKPRGE